MSAGAATAEIELIGVLVRVHASEPAFAERLRACYQPVAPEAGSAAAPTLDAEVCRQDAAWQVRVAGRPPQAAANATDALRACNHEVLHAVMLARPDLFFVHAAVAAVGRRAIVLPGLSRAGKSTLVLGLVAAGASYLSDEILAYDPMTRQALPFLRAVKIRDECVAYFPRWAGKFRGDGEGRFLPFPALGADRVAQAPATPCKVVLPCYGGDSRLEPIARGSGLLRMTESVLNFGTHRQQSLDHLAALAQACTFGRLGWNDPHLAARQILQAMD